MGVCRLSGQGRETPADEIIRCAETPVIEETDIDSLPERYRDIFERLRPYYTLRTDVRVIGEGGVKLIDSSDKSLNFSCPSWLAKEGQGVMLHSTAGTLSAVFECSGSGELRILLRGKFIPASDGVFVGNYTLTDYVPEHEVLKNTSTISKDSITLGETVTLTFSFTGGYTKTVYLKVIVK